MRREEKLRCRCSIPARQCGRNSDSPGSSRTALHFGRRRKCGNNVGMKRGRLR